VTPTKSNNDWNLLENIGKIIPCLQYFKERQELLDYFENYGAR
jgi:hypothetical protein